MLVKPKKKQPAVCESSKRTNPCQKDLCSLIQERAYQLYEKHGYSDGNDLGDWFTAEEQIKKEIQRKR